MSGLQLQSPPQAILFDWDNTLADNWSAILGAMNETLSAFGLPRWTLAESRERIKASLRDSFPRLFGERWREATDIYRQAFERDHLVHLREMPGASLMLAQLRAHGLYLAVVSNKSGRYLRREAAHLGWDAHFDRLVGAQDAAADKPAVAPVALALAGSGITCGPHVWFVGDADIDVTCARNAGCAPILLRAHPPSDEEFAVGGLPRHIRSCMELVELVGQLGVSRRAEL